MQAIGEIRNEYISKKLGNCWPKKLPKSCTLCGNLEILNVFFLQKLIHVKFDIK